MSDGEFSSSCEDVDRKNTSSPLVSVLMLSFNYGRFLDRAIQSVLNQTYRNFELIVVDDGSEDDSWDRLMKYQKDFPGTLRVFSHEGHAHLGIVDSFRLAFSKANGSLVAFLDADDYWQECNLEKKAAVFDTHPEVAIVYSGYRPFGNPAETFYWRLYETVCRRGIPFGIPFDLFSILLRRNAVATFSNFMTRRSALRTVPVPETSERNYDWWILGHLSLKGAAYFIPEKLFFWRIHRASACYGRVTKITLGRLFFFLNRYYRSLEKELLRIEDVGGGEKTKKIRRAISFLENIKNRKQYRFAKEFILRPLETGRFLGYLFLRNLLFGKRVSFSAPETVAAGM